MMQTQYRPQMIHVPTAVPVQRYFADPFVPVRQYGFGDWLQTQAGSLFGAGKDDPGKIGNALGVNDPNSQGGKIMGALNGIGDKVGISGADLAKGIGTAVGAGAYQLGTGNFDRGTGAGKAISGAGAAVGGFVGKANPLLGAAITAGSGIIGGLANRITGYHLNDAVINAIGKDTDALNSTRVADSSNESIANQAAAQDWGGSFNIHDIGNWGWASKGKVENQYNRLMRGMNSARNYAVANYGNAADNVTKNTMNNLLINSAAMGGFFDNPFNHPGSAAIAYGNEQQRLNDQRMMLENAQQQSQQPFTMPGNSYGMGGCLPFCYGGKFFADGGMMNSHGSDFTNGLMYIDEGGTHEENPYQGVPMGHDSQGVPNVVEQDEVIVPSKVLDGQGDYVLSNRIPVTEELAEKYRLSPGTTIAQAAKKLTKESRENPTDLIAQNTDKAIMLELVKAQEEQKQRQQQMRQMAAQQMPAQMPPEQQPQLGAMGGRLFGYGGPVNSFATGSGLFAYPETVYNRPAGNQYATSRKDAWDSLMANRILQWAKDNITEGQTSAERLAALEQLNTLQDLYRDAGMVTDDLSTTRRSEAIGRLQDQANKMGINDVFDELRLEDYFGNHKGRLGDVVPTYKDNTSGGLTGLRTGGYSGMFDPRLADYLRSMGVNWFSDPTRDGMYYAEPMIGDEQDNILQYPNSTDVTDSTDSIGNTPAGDDGSPAASRVAGTDAGGGAGDTQTSRKPLPTWMRKVPLWMSGLGVLTDTLGITNRPDYSAADELRGLARSSAGYMPVSYHPTGEQMAYRPFDPLLQNILNQAGTAASRRGIIGNSNGNGAAASAALVALDRNANLAAGQLGLQGRQYNDEQLGRVLAFNNEVNARNSQGIFGADSQNAANWARQRDTFNSLMGQAIAQRQAAKDKADATRALNLSNFAKSMGALGKENRHYNTVNSNPAYGGYGASDSGIHYNTPTLATPGIVPTPAMRNQTNPYGLNLTTPGWTQQATPFSMPWELYQRFNR